MRDAALPHVHIGPRSNSCCPCHTQRHGNLCNITRTIQSISFAPFRLLLTSRVVLFLTLQSCTACGTTSLQQPACRSDTSPRLFLARNTCCARVAHVRPGPPHSHFHFSSYSTLLVTQSDTNITPHAQAFYDARISSCCLFARTALPIHALQRLCHRCWASPIPQTRASRLDSYKRAGAYASCFNTFCSCIKATPTNAANLLDLPIKPMSRCRDVILNELTHALNTQHPTPNTSKQPTTRHSKHIPPGCNVTFKYQSYVFFAP